MSVRSRLSGLSFWVLLLCATTLRAEPVPALSLHGEPKYQPGFSHFEYVNPDAPKGGDVRLAQIGSFDSLNGFILKGSAATALGMLYDTLTYNSDDEAFTEYGLLAERIDLAEDLSHVTFGLRRQARFHDGEPVTAADVAYTFELLRSKAHPFYRSYYAGVDRVEELDRHNVRFHFKPGVNRELPLILGQMAVLPKHYWEGREFDRTTLEPPLGSGPYRIAKVDAGRSITYERVPDYWGADLPVNRGRNNFASIRYDYYRDATVALEAFKAGEYDFRVENIAKDWATGYDSPALKKGLIRQEEIAHEQPTGMQGFVFNTRRELFADRRVRQALGYAFDFEWANQNLFFGAYTRTRSYFSNSELASRGLPTGEELLLLQKHRDQLPPEVFTQTYEPPVSDGSGNIRGNLRQAMRLLTEAGWQVKNGRLVHKDSGRPFDFELMLVSPSFERIALPFRKNLERLGIDMQVRTVDSSQYEKRLEDFDFDMVVMSRGQSLSPGNEQHEFWSSETANTPGSRNLAGVNDPVVDALIEALISAPDRDSLIQRTRALDRVLLWGHYVIPQWHLRTFRVASWDMFGRPAVTPKYALGFDAWWVDADKAAALKSARQQR